MKSKNLIILHLESLSWQTYNIYKDYLQNLDNIFNNSLLFSNFFSSSTSSMMAIQNILYGNDNGLDHLTDFNTLNEKLKDPSNNLFNILKKKNYNTYGYGSPSFSRSGLEFFNIWDKDRPFQWIDKRDLFIKSITENIEKKNNQPFAIYIWDLISHLAFSDNLKKEEKYSFDRISYGYRMIDETVKTVLESLEKSDKLNSTVILGFGDHGDDYFTHSLSGGFCHAIEPYTNLIHTPMFILDQQINKEKNSNLSSLIDIKETILNLLSIEHNKDIFGIDILKKSNDVIYSQNLFINQIPSKFLNKSFSVTNRRYHLIVSELGLEMYNYLLDKTNHNNLLSFFKIINNKLFFDNRGASHVHFNNFFGKFDIEDIINNFYTLSGKLKNHLKQKENKLINKKNIYCFGNFNKIRKRKYLWILPNRRFQAKLKNFKRKLKICKIISCRK